MCGISVTKVSLFCDPRESPLEKMRHDFYLMYIRDNIQKEKNGTAREEIERYLSSVTKCAEIVFGNH